MTTPKLTVGELKAKLADCSDDTAVLLMVGGDCEDAPMMAGIDSVTSYGEDDFEYIEEDPVIPNVVLVIE